MRFLDWLTEERVRIPVAEESFEDVLSVLAGAIPDAFAPAQRSKLARDLAFGVRGEVVRLHDEIIAVVAEQERLTAPMVFVGVSPEPFPVTAEGKDVPGSARAVILALVPGRATAFRVRMVPDLRRYFAGEGRAEAFLDAPDAATLLSLPGLAELDFPEKPTVAEAVKSVQYRIYPETPVDELVDLMVRRGLHAVPVVGEGYEVLGIVTSGDALRHLLAQSRTGGENGMARDVMTRTVLCVSEDQELEEVPQLMVNRDVEQLPVVREGQLVGFITRDSALAALFGGSGTDG